MEIKVDALFDALSATSPKVQEAICLGGLQARISKERICKDLRTYYLSLQQYPPDAPSSKRSLSVIKPR